MTLRSPISFSLLRAGIALPVLVAVFLLQRAPLVAQAAVSFEATAETREIVEGGTFEVSFSLKNAQGSRFVMPDLKGFKIVGGPSEMRGMSIVNGQSMSHQTWTFDLEAPRTGTFTIGAASVTANGKTLTTKPLTIQVVPSRAGKGAAVPPPGSDDQIFIASELDHETAYPGQQVTWRIKLYTQLSVEGADLIELPDFEGFFSKEKRRFDTRVRYQTVRGKKYAVKTLHEEALFPQEAKEYNIGIAKVRAAVEASGGLSMLLGAKPVLLQTQPVRLRVKPLPAPVPASFSGAVGQYEYTVSSDKGALTTDDALTVTMLIQGNGDANRVTVPVLASSDSLEVFEPKVKAEESYENMEQVVHSKTLEYVVLPKEPGTYSIQPAFAFFDPDSNRFIIKTAQKIEFVVTAGKNYQPKSTEPDSLSLPAPVSQSISQKWYDSPLLWWGLSGLFVLILLFLIFRKKRSGQVHVLKEQQIQPMVFPAQKTFRDRFASMPELLRNGEPKQFYDALLKSLQSYLSENLQIPPAQMNVETVRQRLREYQASPLVTENILTIWEVCEQSIYAGKDQASIMEGTWKRTEMVLKELDGLLRRNSAGRKF
ncbi:MAG TPA: BatD family protein [Saprospiraceae bacterium]|nr:BatD family protein [Saprospiraceae bacterium]HPI06346.1 BatD family protein [Saprospiraceae bacterium]